MFISRTNEYFETSYIFCGLLCMDEQMYSEFKAQWISEGHGLSEFLQNIERKVRIIRNDDKLRISLTPPEIKLAPGIWDIGDEWEQDIKSIS